MTTEWALQMFWDQWTLDQAIRIKFGTNIALIGMSALIVVVSIVNLLADKSVSARSDEADKKAAEAGRRYVANELAQRDGAIGQLRHENKGLKGQLVTLTPRSLTKTQASVLAKELHKRKFNSITFYWYGTGEPQIFAASLRDIAQHAGQQANTAEYIDRTDQVGIVIPADLNGRWHSLKEAFDAAKIPTIVNHEIGPLYYEAAVIIGPKIVNKRRPKA